MSRLQADRSAPATPGAVALYPPAFDETRHLSDQELAMSLEQALGDWDGSSDLWLFGYGSLIWNPGLPTVEACPARVPGYHRGLYMWSRINRGTPQQPGLVLALDRGGSCPGVAYRLAAKGAMPHLEALWKREMGLYSYRPAWLKTQLADGRRVLALAFVLRRDIGAYAGRLSDEVLRTVLQCASGQYGSTRDYVTRTVEALRAAGTPDRNLEAVLKRCG